MKRMKWAVSLSTTILSTVLVMAISSPRLAVRADSKPALGILVEIDNFNFGPERQSHGRTMMTFRTRLSDNKLFKSKALDTDDRYSYTLTKPGTYVYYCTVHQKMTAKIFVK